MIVLNEISKKLVNRYLNKTEFSQLTGKNREKGRILAKLKLDPSKRSHPLKDKKVKANVLATEEQMSHTKEALIAMSEKRLEEMREKLFAALSEKASEKLEEMKTRLAAKYLD